MLRFLFISLFCFFFIAHSFTINVNILDYGAIKSKSILSTAAIQQSIDECCQKGGGRVTVPAGDYLSASIILKNNVELYLEQGATIYASRNEEDYATNLVAAGAADNAQKSFLIGAFNAENISLTGLGTLNGQAERRQIYMEGPYNETWLTYREWKNADEYKTDFRTKYKIKAPATSLVNFNNCRNVHIKDISLYESNMWGMHIQWCNMVWVKGIQIYSSAENGVNSDGLDVDGCQNITVSDCIIKTGDDALCLKTTKSSGKSMPCENITISNCILRSSSAGLKIGTESYSDFRNIKATGCIIENANRGVNIVIRDGGTVDNVLFADFIITNQRKATFWWGNGDPVWIVVQNREHNSRTGEIRNVTFDHIIAHGESGCRIEGFSSQIENVRISDFQLFMEYETAKDKRARDGFSFYNVAGLSLSNCVVRWNEVQAEERWESALRFEKVSGLLVDKVATTQAPNRKFAAIKLIDVQDATVQCCMATKPCNLFFEISGKESRELVFSSNYLQKTGTPMFIGNEVNKNAVKLEK